MRIGSYLVERKISEGTFGRTFLGRHVILGVPVCLKQEKTGDPTFMQLFEEEAKLLWGIHHSSLPTLKDYLEHPGFGQVAVMSFIQGDSLATVLEDRGPVDDEHICWILQRVLDALSYLHYCRVVHCDIKPANIILDIPTHNAVLVDFGLALEGPLAGSRAKGGTPFFVPPEFMQGLPPIPASDMYSLGMTALALAGGNVGNGSFPPDMAPELVVFIQQMIRRDATTRVQDARELNHELTKLRQSVFGRTHTNEAFKLRRST
jgi:eukaryotic-like serine/threonine-protein kinase